MTYRVESAEVAQAAAEHDALWNRNFAGEPVVRSRLYLDNPAGPGRVWSLRTGRGELVGAVGCLDRRFKLGAVHCRIGQAVAFAVDPSHRSAGPALMLQRALVTGAGEACPLMLGVTRNAKAVFARIGYRPLGEVQRWVKPFAYEEPLRRYLPPAFVRKPVAAALDVVFRALSPEYRRLDRRYHHDLAIGFDARVDDLWRRAERHLDITSVRDCVSLRWRFPHARVLRLIEPAGALAAYAVYTLDDDVAVVQDVLWADRALISPLLAALLRHLRREPVRAVRLAYVGGPELPRHLRAFGFRRHPDARVAFVHGAAPDDPAINVNRWHLTGADLEL